MSLAGRYLVTGAGGFVGSHLCEALIDRGCAVLSIDNFLTGRRDNLKNLLGNSRFEHLDHDVIKPFEVEGGLAGIFHFASPASPVDYAKYPIETLRVGSVGSDNVLQLAMKMKCPILVASTSEVYGDPLEHPQKETYWGNVNPIGPRGCYDESKRYLEAVTMAYRRVHAVSTRIVRIFNTYGPRMRTDDGRVVPNFCIQALSGQHLTIYGDGLQTRSFCYVSDLIEGILRAFEADHSEPINLGNPVEMTILDFARKIIELSGANVKIVHRPLPQDDPTRRKPDISKAQKLLGWSPKVTLDEGLAKTVEFFRTARRS